MQKKFDVILLAAQRAGLINPLAQAHGVSHKALIPIAGQSLITRMMDILTSHPGCRAIHILIEPDGEAAARAVVDAYARPDLQIEFVTSSENIATSVIRGCENGTAPFVITTADNVLLKHDSIDRVMAAFADHADAVAALASKDDIRAVHPMAQRWFYEFKDGGYANCNLYGIAHLDALKATSLFSEGGQFMNHPGRLARAIGLHNILLMKFKLITIDDAFKRVSKRFGIQLRRVALADGTQAIDVDNERTYKIVEAVLEDRVEGLIL